MEKAIRVTETIVYEYIPDLGEDFYAENNVATIEQAMEFDRRSCAGEIEDCETSIAEIGDEKSRGLVWEIVDVED